MNKKKANTNFIVIDDNKIDLFLIEKVIRLTFPECAVMSFDKPDEALTYFSNTQPVRDYTVLLDINMPVISGFDFLDAFAGLPEAFKSAYNIFILTSSNNITDIERGKSNPYVSDVLHKPLSKDILLSI